jgi:hypothetical protein
MCFLRQRSPVRPRAFEIAATIAKAHGLVKGLADIFLAF